MFIDFDYVTVIRGCSSTFFKQLRRKVTLNTAHIVSMHNGTVENDDNTVTHVVVVQMVDGSKYDLVGWLRSEITAMANRT